MKKGKRLFCLLLALLCLAGLIGCGEKETEETRTTAESGETRAFTGDLTKEDEAYLARYLADYKAGKYDEGKKFRYDDLREYFLLADYKGIAYPDDEMIRGNVTQEEVEAYITQIYLSYQVGDDQYTRVTEGEIQKYDMATLDYRGILDGKEVEKASAQDQSLLIGSGSFVRGFEEGLLGKKIGEEVVMELKYSPYYSGKEVAGKSVTFHVTVKEVQRPAIPEFQVDVLNEVYSKSFRNMDEARDFIRSALEEQAADRAWSCLSTYLQDDVIGRSTVLSYPEREMGLYKEHFLSYYAQYMTEGQSWEDFCQTQLNTTYEEFLKKAEDYARESVAANLMVRSVAKSEGITCSKEQLASLIRGIYRNQGESYGKLESLVTDYMEIYGSDYFEHQVITESVLELLQKSAVCVPA